MTRRRLLIGLVGAVIAINGVLWGIAKVTGGSPGGPTSSSYATGSDGDAAWAELLLRAGHHVSRIHTTPSHTSLPAGSTAVILDPPLVLDADALALARFVRAGGRLIAGGEDASWLRRIVGGRLVTATGGVTEAHPLAPVPEVTGVNTVETAGSASWSRVGATLPVLGARGFTVAAVATVGKGRVVLLADDSTLQNGYLAAGDDARFALDIAGPPGRDILFFESYHGYGSSSGAAAIPARWDALILFGIAATLIYMWARGRRLGPPELERRELDPPRREYVEALAGILARTRSPELALAPLQAEARRRLTQSGAGPLLTHEALLASAHAHGLSPEEAAAVAADAIGSEDVLPLGRALARLGTGERRHTWQV